MTTLPKKNGAVNNRLRVHVSPVKRHMWMIVGHLSIVAGIIGLLLPLIPTSPFIILAAYCYARSSERFYYILLNNKYFGSYVRHWEENRCVEKKLKILISVVLTLMFMSTIIFFMQSWEMRLFGIVLAAIALFSVWLIPVCDRA